MQEKEVEVATPTVEKLFELQKSISGLGPSPGGGLLATTSSGCIYRYAQGGVEALKQMDGQPSAAVSNASGQIYITDLANQAVHLGEETPPLTECCGAGFLGPNCLALSPDQSDVRRHPLLH